MSPESTAVREPSLAEIKSELQAVLNSRGFRQSRSLSKLLRYLCVNALVDTPDQITEYSIAVDVLGKGSDFKDTKDASVRVEVHRLRKRLAQFYMEEGASHGVRIVIPTGNYAPQFVCREFPAAVEAAEDSGTAAPAADAPLESDEPVVALNQTACEAPAPQNGHSSNGNGECPAAAEPESAVPEERRDIVRTHLERILGSPAFKNSKRYAAVLSYMVERSMEGRADQLRERAIGVAVFGRPADYDTSADHVVRSAAAEVRKRVARYYQEAPDSTDIRIELQPGSYIPRFRFAPDQIPEPPAAIPEQTIVPEETIQAALIQETNLSGWTTKSWVRRGLICALGLLILTVAAVFRTSASDPLDPFWEPVLSSPGNVLLCVGDRGNGQPPAINGQTVTLGAFHHLPSQTMLISDAVALTRFTGFFAAKNRAYRVASHAEVSFSDLQQGPVILLGMSNNHWTQRVVSKLRYTVETTPSGAKYIKDRRNPSRTDLATDFSQPYLDLTKDYALIFRVMDPETERMVVAAAGISTFGTLAAAKLLTDSREIRKLEAIAPRDWKGKNLEAVISTDVIKGQSGHPTIVAAEFW